MNKGTPRRQSETKPRSGLRAHDQSAVGLSAVSERARRGRRQDDSSQALAERFHLNAAQIRKNLANFGEFGVRGVGYYVRDLRRHLRQILGLDRKLRVAIIGAGNLGPRPRRLSGVSPGGLRDRALFELGKKVGQQSTVACRITTSTTSGSSFGATPSASASSPCRRPRPNVADLVVAAGIKAVLNFSPGALGAPGRQAQKRRSDGVAREPVVLPRARRSQGE